ncbi:MAG TPA: winged helix-turn-helix domain-containing protein [Pyrinomonadaceae bacterium]|nr:winged helix-turn-helix domain-containing protein [Pyrinomonadaceae bacterium]
MKLTERREFEFGEFRIDTRRRVLFKNGEQMAISAKLFDLLEVLIRNEGRVMSHDELLETVWSDSFVEQSSLKKGISSLRHILGEMSDESRFIKTVPRRGYSFVGNVAAVEAEMPRLVRHSQTDIVVQQTVVEESRSRWPIYLAIGSFVICILVLAIVVLPLRSSSSVRYDFSPGKSTVERVTSDGNCSGTLSPDGNFIACPVRVGEVGSAIEIRSIDGNTKRKVVEYSDAIFYAVRYSFDGKYLYYVLDIRTDTESGALYRVSVLGGDAIKIESNVGSVSVSPTGKLAISRTVASGDAQVLIQDEKGIFSRIAASFPKEFRIWDFRFTPEENGMLCAVRKQISSEKNVFYVTETSLTNGTEKIVVPERETLIANAAWLPDRSALILAVREQNADIRQLWQYSPDSGKMERITNDDVSYQSIELADNGRSIVSHTLARQARIWVSESSDNAKPPFTFKPIEFAAQSVGHIFWTPDGKIGYVTNENRSEVVKLVAPETGDITRITAGTDGIWLQPTLGGDGRSVVYNSNVSGLTQLWRADLDGRNPKRLTESPLPLFNGMTTADGTVYYYTSEPTEGWFLARKDTQGAVSVVVKGPVDAWDISNDGRMLSYFRMNETTKLREIAILSLPDLTLLKEFPVAAGGGVRQTNFSADGRSISYLVASHFAGELFGQDLAGGPPVKLSNFGGESLFSFDRTADGKRLAVARGHTVSDTSIIRSAGSDR